MDKHESGLHVANVLSRLESIPVGETMDDWLQQSWRRSVEQYRIDPGRICMAALNSRNLDAVAAAIAKVLAS